MQKHLPAEHFSAQQTELSGLGELHILWPMSMFCDNIVKLCFGFKMQTANELALLHRQSFGSLYLKL